MKLVIFHRFEIYFLKVLTTLRKVEGFLPFLFTRTNQILQTHTHSRKLCSEQKYFFIFLLYSAELHSYALFFPYLFETVWIVLIHAQDCLFVRQISVLDLTCQHFRKFSLTGKGHILGYKICIHTVTFPPALWNTRDKNKYTVCYLHF